VEVYSDGKKNREPSTTQRDREKDRDRETDRVRDREKEKDRDRDVERRRKRRGKILARFGLSTIRFVKKPCHFELAKLTRSCLRCAR
jgi:Ni/Co efflux regulator RcnB